jgi:hypothetical protein
MDDSSAPVGKRRRAAAVQDAGAFFGGNRTSRSVLECASPLALWQVADDEAASGAPEHSLSGKAQTSRRRLAMTHQAWAKYQCTSHALSFKRMQTILFVVP